MDDNFYTYLRIEHYSAHPEVRAAADLLVEQATADKAFVKDRRGWVGAARKLVASLWLREDDMFRFGTKKDHFAGKGRKQVWLTPKTLRLFNTMRELGWVNLAFNAIPPAYAKKSSGGLAAVYCRHISFKKLMRELTLDDVEVDEELPWVTLRDSKDNLRPLPEKYLASASYQQTVSTLKNHHRLLRISLIKGAVGEPLAALTYRYIRKWKGTTGNGGRFYSPFCNLPKAERLGITINGEAVGSWDFSQLHPTLLLLLRNGIGTEVNLFATGDVYDMPDYCDLPRSAHKKFINTILNAETKQAAIRSIATAHCYYNILDDHWVYETYNGRQRRQGEPVWADKAQKAAEAYIDTFTFRHPNFADIAFKGMWGTLQLIDSSIIEEALKRATELGIPVLPVHDELVVPMSKQSVAHKLLIDSFHHVTQGKFADHEPSLSWSTS